MRSLRQTNGTGEATWQAPSSMPPFQTGLRMPEREGYHGPHCQRSDSLSQACSMSLTAEASPGMSLRQGRQPYTSPVARPSLHGGDEEDSPLQPGCLQTSPIQDTTSNNRSRPISVAAVRTTFHPSSSWSKPWSSWRKPWFSWSKLSLSWSRHVSVWIKHSST